MNHEDINIGHEITELKTSIKYHNWFLGLMFLGGLTVSGYLINSVDNLQETTSGIEQRLSGLEGKLELLIDAWDIAEPSPPSVVKK